MTRTCSCSNRNHPAWVGKGNPLEHELCVGRREKNDHANCSTTKSKAGDNGADVWTVTVWRDTLKPWDGSSCLRQIHSALTVNNLSAQVSVENLALEVENRFKRSGKNGRVDTNGFTTTKLTRPRTREDRLGETVACRVTADARSGRHQHRRRDEHEPRLVEGGTARSGDCASALQRQWSR